MPVLCWWPIPGGVDSTFLVAMAAEVLTDRVLAVTAFSPVHPHHEIEEAKRFAQQRKIEHLVIESGEMTLPLFFRKQS